VQLAEADGGWWIDVAARDKPGLLAGVTGAITAEGLDAQEAIVATWPDGAALESFRVNAEERPDASRLQAAIEASYSAPLSSLPLAEALVTFDDSASPWHTVCEVRAPDKPGLLHSLANAFAAARVEVHSARVSADKGVAADRFDVTDRDGHKLDEATKASVINFVSQGVTTKRRRFRRSSFVMTPR
jgi:[protein-PII] uridylyltransferase